MIKKIYKLSAKDVEFARKLGEARDSAKPASVRSNCAFTKSTSYGHMVGLFGEVAYAKVTGKLVDDEIFEHGDIDDFDGVEIKTCTWKGADAELKIKKSEFARKFPYGYVLIRVDVDNQSVEFLGSISRKRFDEIKYPRCHRTVENWCVLAKDLSPVVVVYNDKLELIPLTNS